MIKAIIFDCFGVLYGGSLGMLASLAPAERRQDVNDINTANDYGYIHYQEYLEQIGEIIGKSPAEVDVIMRQSCLMKWCYRIARASLSQIPKYLH